MSKVGRGRKSTIYRTKAQRRLKKSAASRKSDDGSSDLSGNNGLCLNAIVNVETSEPESTNSVSAKAMTSARGPRSAIQLEMIPPMPSAQSNCASASSLIGSTSNLAKSFEFGDAADPSPSSLQQTLMFVSEAVPSHRFQSLQPENRSTNHMSSSHLESDRSPQVVATDSDASADSKDSTGLEAAAERSGRRRLKSSYCNEVLAKGLSLGRFNFTVTVPGASGTTTTFKCTNDCLGGRGLRVVHAVKANVVIARGLGTLVRSSQIPDTSNYKVWDSKNSYLSLHAPSIEYPANLANTNTEGDNKNNCKLMHKAGSNYVTIKTLRPLQAGEEVTVAYGSKFKKEIRDVIALKRKEHLARIAINPNTFVTCPRCQFQCPRRKLKYHVGRIHCLRRISQAS